MLKQHPCVATSGTWYAQIVFFVDAKFHIGRNKLSYSFYSLHVLTHRCVKQHSALKFFVISLILYTALCFSVLPSASSCAVDGCFMNLCRNSELPLFLSSFSLYPHKRQYNVSATHYTRSHLPVFWMWISFFLCKLELTVFISHYLTLSRPTTSSLKKEPMLQKRHAFIFAPKVFCHGRSDLKMLWKYARLVGLTHWHFPQGFPNAVVASPF